MKKIYTLISLIIFSVAAWAQTYNGGQWYSMIATQEYSAVVSSGFWGDETNEQTFAVFPPTETKMTYQWKNRKYFLGSNNYGSVVLKFFESKNNGSSYDSETQVVDCGVFTDKTTYESGEYTMKFSSTINRFKFTLNTTWGAYVKDLRLPLKHHILFDNGTNGSNSWDAKDFGELTWGEASAPYAVNLRSFYTYGDITVTSSLPDVFRIGSATNTNGLTYAVGANACASKNGQSGAQAGGSTLGDISQYNFNIYFCPQEAVDYQGTITITDGTSTLTVAVSGKGLMRDQQINWEQAEGTFLSNATLTAAQATSGLDIDYSFEPEGVITFENGALHIVQDFAQVTVTAAQAGDDTHYNAASPISKTFVIRPAVTYGQAEGSVCQGTKMEFLSGEYAVGEHEVHILNVWGGDSIITLVVSELPVHNTTDGATICPSELPYTWATETFTEAGSKTLKFSNIYGCDSIVTFTLNVLPTFATTVEEDKVYGDELLWKGETLVLVPGDLTLLDSLRAEQNGCDSVVTLIYHVAKKQQTISFTLDSLNYFVGDSILPVATSDSQLDVTLSFDNEQVATWVNDSLYFYAEGEVVLTASQEGDDNYLPAEPVELHLIVTTRTEPEVETGVVMVNGGNGEGLMVNGESRKVLINNRLFILRGKDAFTPDGRHAFGILGHGLTTGSSLKSSEPPLSPFEQSSLGAPY